MPDPNPTVGEIFKAKAVTDDEVNAAVEVYMSNAETGAHPIAEGYIQQVGSIPNRAEDNEVTNRIVRSDQAEQALPPAPR
ncbi:hypothetical protein [Methylobacterium sp. B4]|uniref:hypothetical protein n=1 Tax=Methylobacterium sp. B4 TaxID=1938755 RepID=UPI000D753517|nr:hypothetical protein [Methylobacterium sp. B4]PXW51316.1 hypothetical protein BY998_13538 [Methylobacterium sp. B4]